MSVVRFVDTNILVYAHDLDAGEKRVKALALISEWWRRPEETAISVQVLQELHVNLARNGASREEASQIVRRFYAWTVVETTLSLFDSALHIQQRWQISLWDALILAAARESGARDLITEDLNTGQDYGGVIVRNPFAAANN